MSDTVLDEAANLVYGTRQQEYGHPRHNYAVIAALWNAYLDGVALRSDTMTLTPEDAAQLMLLMKVARFATGSRKRDTLVDEAGYVAVTARAMEMDA